MGAVVVAQTRRAVATVIVKDWPDVPVIAGLIATGERRSITRPARFDLSISRFRAVIALGLLARVGSVDPDLEWESLGTDGECQLQEMILRAHGCSVVAVNGIGIVVEFSRISFHQEMRFSFVAALKRRRNTRRVPQAYKGRKARGRRQGLAVRPKCRSAGVHGQFNVSTIKMHKRCRLRRPWFQNNSFTKSKNSLFSCRQHPTSMAQRVLGRGTELVTRSRAIAPR